MFSVVPRFVQEVVDMELTINSSTARSGGGTELFVTFTCTVDSQPLAELTWFYNTTIEPRISILSDVPSPERQVSTLTLSNVQFGDQGEFTCNATSPYGSISSSAILSIFGEQV